MNQERSETETRNLELVQIGFERWKEGTGSVYDLLAPTAQWTIVGNSLMSKVYQSRQEFMDEVIHPFNARLSSPLVPAVRGLYADGDTVIELFDATGTARDGKPYRRLRTSGDSALRGLQLRPDLLSNGTSHTKHSDEPDQAGHLRRRARQAPRSTAPGPPE
jgi:ketosteroid isomerase-like protein